MREACDFLRDSPGHHLAFALGAHHCLGLRPRGCRRGLCCRSCLGGSLTLLLSRRRGRSRWETTLGGMRLCRLLRSAAAPTNCPGSAMILCSENTQRLADTCDRRHVLTLLFRRTKCAISGPAVPAPGSLTYPSAPITVQLGAGPRRLRTRGAVGGSGGWPLRDRTMHDEWRSWRAWRR